MSGISDQMAVSLVHTRIRTSWMSGDNQSITPDLSITSTPESTSTITSTFPVETGPIFQTVMTGTDLKNVGVQTTQGGGYVVGFELNEEGTLIFKDFTSSHIGKILGIVLDKEVISIPSINTAITGGKGVIEGRFTAEEANLLHARRLARRHGWWRAALSTMQGLRVLYHHTAGYGNTGCAPGSIETRGRPVRPSLRARSRICSGVIMRSR